MAASSHTASTSSAGFDQPAQHAHHPHHRHKKSNDPFLTRSLTAEVGEQFRQPSPGQPDKHAEQDGISASSLLADLIVTPLTWISFLFSLALIDRQQRQWRLSQHSPNATAGWSLDPEPYKASPGPGQENERPASGKGNSANAYSGWYTRKKKRAMARMEISDALEMRKRVVVALLVWSALVLWGIAYVLRTIWRWTFRT